MSLIEELEDYGFVGRRQDTVYMTEEGLRVLRVLLAVVGAAGPRPLSRPARKLASALDVQFYSDGEPDHGR